MKKSIKNTETERNIETEREKWKKSMNKHRDKKKNEIKKERWLRGNVFLYVLKERERERLILKLDCLKIIWKLKRLYSTIISGILIVFCWLVKLWDKYSLT